MSFIEELKRRNVIRVAIGYLVIAWLIIQIGDTLGPALRLPEWIPSALAFFLILGFPIAMYLSWVYDMTPEGIKPDSASATDSRTGSQTGRLNRVILVAATVAIAYFGIDQFLLNKPPEPVTHENKAAGPEVSENESQDSASSVSGTSIAVLPFVNMSSDPEQEYFSDGMSEELLNLLARIPELQVTSRSSAFAYKGKEINIAEVASTLGVTHVLEGSVRKSGEQVRITAQLIDAGRDIHLWSKTYDRQLDNVFAIQDEISAAVVSALEVTLLGKAPKASSIDPRAMDLNLQARYFWHRRSDGDEERAREYYERSLEIDQNNAPAWAGLAVIYNELMRSGELSKEEGTLLFLEAGRNAVEADPNFSEGHIRLAWALARDGDIEGARKHREIANQLDPNGALVLWDRAVQLLQIGRMDLAIEINEKLRDMDPLAAINWGNLGAFYIDVGRYKDAEQAILKTLELAPGSSNANFNLARLRILEGKFEESLEIIEGLPDSNYKWEFLAIISHAMGDSGQSQAFFDRIVDEPGRPAQSWRLDVHAYRGELDEAFAIMEQGLLAGLGFNIFLTNPFLLNMHADPRWDRLLSEAGWVPGATLD